MKKKILTVLLVGVLAGTVNGCGTQTSAVEETTEIQENETEEITTLETDTEENSEDEGTEENTGLRYGGKYQYWESRLDACDFLFDVADEYENINSIEDIEEICGSENIADSGSVSDGDYVRYEYSDGPLAVLVVKTQGDGIHSVGRIPSDENEIPLLTQNVISEYNNSTEIKGDYQTISSLLGEGYIASIREGGVVVEYYVQTVSGDLALLKMHFASVGTLLYSEYGDAENFVYGGEETPEGVYTADEDRIGEYDLAGNYSCDDGGFFLAPSTGEEEEDGSCSMFICNITLQGVDLGTDDYVNLSPTVTYNVYVIDDTDYVISFTTNADGMCEAYIYSDGVEQAHLVMTERVIGG